MARDDLLSLSIDDLASMTNRGTVKRAEKELAAGQLEFDIKEGSDGHLLVNWSDGIECEFQGELQRRFARVLDLQHWCHGG